MTQDNTQRGRGSADDDGHGREEDPGTAGHASDTGAQDGVLGSIRLLGEEIGGMLRECARLAGTESRLFAVSLLLIVVLGVALGFLFAGALLLLSTAFIALLMVHVGLDPVLSVLSGLLLVCLLCGLLLLWIRRLVRDLRFEQTRAAFADVVARAGESSQ